MTRDQIFYFTQWIGTELKMFTIVLFPGFPVISTCTGQNVLQDDKHKRFELITLRN